MRSFGRLTSVFGRSLRVRSWFDIPRVLVLTVLAVHCLIGLAVGAVSVWQLALLALVLSLGVLRSSARFAVYAAVALEFVLALNLSFIFALQTGGVNSYFASWFFIFSLYYPLQLGRPLGGWSPLLISVLFVALIPFSLQPVALPLMVARVMLIALNGWLLYYLGQQLKNTEAFYRVLSERSNEGIAIADPQGVIRYLNPASRQLFGYSDAEMLGHNRADLIHPEDRAAFMAALERLKPGEGARLEYRFRFKNGRWCWLEGHLTNLCEHPAVGGYAIASWDITARKRIQEELERTEAFYRALIEKSAEGIVIFDKDKKIRFQSLSGMNLSGYSDREVVGLDRSDILHPDDLDNFNRTIEALKPDEGTLLHYRIVTREGEVVWLQGRVTNLVNNPVIGGYVVNFHNISNLKRTEQALQKLSERLVTVQEEERRTIARDLHDEVGQLLTAAKVSIQTAQRLGQPEAFAHALSSVDSVLNYVRELSLSLHPRILEDLGLAAALRWYVIQQTKHSSVTIRLNVQLSEVMLSPELEINIYRIVQEGLTNILRHSQAQQAEIALATSHNRLILTINDDGVGFDALALSTKSLGFLSMRERVTVHGGQFEVLSSKGQGTTLRATFPLEEGDRGYSDTPG
jgi:PAS domain S-box-containing protein